MCPAAMGKIRCPLRPASMTLDPRTGPRSSPRPSTRPPAAPSRPSPCRPRPAPRPRRSTTTPPRSTGKSYARRTGAERTFSTAKDPASNNIARGWTRLMGLAPRHALAHLPAGRPQPAHPDRLGRPPGRQRPPRRGRPAPENPAPPPQDPRQPGHRSAAITPAPPIPRPSPAHPRSPRPRHGGHNLLPGTATAARQPALNPAPAGNPPGAHENVRPKREDKRRSNVKTFWVRRQGIEPRTRGLRVRR